MVVGGVAKKQFLKTYPGHTLPLVESKEPHGTFIVPNYPDSFTSRLQDIIALYADEIKAEKAKKISKKVTEKPSRQLPISTSEPQKKVRKRIPIQRPAFSGQYRQK
jgi:hypothetical protein